MALNPMGVTWHTINYHFYNVLNVLRRTINHRAFKILGRLSAVKRLLCSARRFIGALARAGAAEPRIAHPSVSR
jgi:hypothetical protein